ncbi:MAG: DUF1559 domain-containing protein [Planctomycetota bacterium]
MKQIGLAVANYHASYNVYPPAFTTDAAGKPLHSWRVLILPYMEQQKLYDKIRLDEPWDSAANSLLHDQMPQLFSFHGEHRPGKLVTNYLAVVGPGTMWPGGECRKDSEIKDELSDTILVVEDLDLKVHWMQPRDHPAEALEPESLTSKYEAPAAVMADGLVIELKTPIDANLLDATLTVSGQESIDPSKL